MNGKLKFEGEYLFNEKFKGKLYDYNGNILYKLNNNEIIEEVNDTITIYFVNNILTKINNNEIIKGKKYDFNVRLLFDGEFKNKNGKE